MTGIECKRIEITDFRNIRSAVIEPRRGVNLLLGDNAAGKTSALEGIYLFASGRSFRAATEPALIRFGAAMAGLRLTFDDGEDDELRTLELRYCVGRNNAAMMRAAAAAAEAAVSAYTAGAGGDGEDIGTTLKADGGGQKLPRDKRPASEARRIAKVDGEPVRKLSEFVGIFRAVIFAPEDLSLIKGGPAVRRELLDSALSRLYPQYLGRLSDYNSLLRQRNALLRSHRQRGGDCSDARFTASLSLWSEQLAPLSEQIALARAEYALLLQKGAGELMKGMSSGREELGISVPPPKSADEYLAQLTAQIPREFAMGTTLFGIHRDDMTVTLGGLPLRSFGSQGQQRTAALSIKLAEGDAVKAVKGDWPVFLLDDILSELDPGRQELLLDCLSGRQVIITAAQQPPSCGGAHVICVSGGKFEPTK